MEATLGRTTWASRLPRRHGRRAQAPRDGWWLAPTCRKHAATSPDRPRPGSAQACARRCVQRAGRLAGWLWVDMGRREPSRRSPSTQDMHVNHVGRTGWAGGRCGGVAATLRGSGEHARWPHGWVPEDARPEVLPIVPRPLPRTAPAQHAYVPGAHGKFNAHVVRRVLHTH